MRTMWRSTMVTGLFVCVTAGAALAQKDEAARKPPPAAGAPRTMVAPTPPRQPPPPEVMPPPAPELVAAGKAMRGTYRCKGFNMNPDGSSRPSAATMRISTDLDGYWIVVELAEQKTRANPTPFKAKMFRTYDAKARTWTMVTLSIGGHAMTQTSTDPAGADMTWTGSGEMQGMRFTERSHEEPDVRHRTVHLWGEASMDGRHFMKDYDVTCKR